jgi:two-component system, LytTR family, response regulator
MRPTSIRIKIRVLLVDDEPLARERLRAMLNDQAGVEIVGEAGDGESAIRAIRLEKPDVVFLDIHMPGMDGFEVLESLEPETTPWTIFLTAFNQHAMRAFEARALDYLLKPASRARLAAALVRVRDRLLAAEPVPALREWLAARETSKRLVVRDGSQIVFVRIDSVIWMESAGNYVIIHTIGDNHILRETLNDLEQRLPRESFLRVSRSAIVNLHHLSALHCETGRWTAVLANGQHIPVTRARQEIEKRLCLP